MVGDYDDPEVSDSTPGCVLTFTPGVDTNTPVLGSSAARRPPRRIPPSYVTGTVDAFWATVQMQAAVLVIRTSISQTSPGSESGPDLTPTAESTVGVALRAETGETISFLLSELNDSTEPYQRNLDNNSGSDPAFDTAPVSTFSGAEYTACRDAFISGGGSVVIVDTAHANVDWDALEFIGESPDPATDQTVTAEGRHDTRGKTTITEDHRRGTAPVVRLPPDPPSDQPVTAEGRHATRGEASITEETPSPTPATDQTITAEGRHGTRGEATVEDLLPVVGPLRDLRVSVGGRDYSDHVERGDWRIIRRTGVRSEARFRIIAKPGEIDIPNNGDTVIATATLGGIVTLFGGYLDEPEIDAYTGTVGLYDLNLQSIGFRARLDDTLLTQLQGIDIVQLATAADQIEALVALLSGEGFTSTVTLPADDNPDPEGMRLRHIGPVLDSVASLNNAIPVVSATKVVSVVARDLVTGDLILDETNTELLRVEDSRQNYRTASR